MLTLLLTIVGILLGVVILLCVFYVLGSTLEKIRIPTFVELPAAEKPILTPYMEAMNRGAAEAGFDRHETARHAKGGGYQIYACFWQSPQRDIIVAVCRGKMMPLGLSRTQLISKLTDGSYLITSDDPLLAPTSLERFKLLIKADFAELLELHRSRLSEQQSEPQAFLDDSPLAVFSEKEKRTADWLEAHGHIRCIEPSGTTWRFTFKGALRMFRRAHSLEMHCTPDQKARWRYPAPSTREFEAMQEAEAPVRILLDSSHLLYFDPMALDELREVLISSSSATEGPSPKLLNRLHRELGVGYCRIADFRPGEYEVGLRDLDESFTESEINSVEWASTDSASLVFMDYVHANQLLSHLNWEAYDRALQAPEDDDSPFRDIADRIGGPYFVVMNVGADGMYRLAPEAPRRVERTRSQDGTPYPARLV